ncbi:MAG: DUF4293 family protein [Balneolaceae bacterium]|nr:MAG: DUF4293 family protein [Balneolaceae bacterium]
MSLLNLSVFKTSVYSRAMADPAVWIGSGFALSLTLAMFTGFIAIFLYKKRGLQLNVVKWGTFLQIVAFGFSSGILFSLGGFGTFLVRESVGVMIILAGLLFYWLAGKNIRKDEELVKSADRIR